MSTPDLHQLLLYWMSPSSEARFLGTWANPEDKYYQWLLRDCYVSDREVPTKEECLVAAQSLIDEGLALAYRLDSNGNRKDVDRLKANMLEPFELFFDLTERGEAKAEAFPEFLRSDTGRLRSAEFTRHQVAEFDLPFIVVVPDFVPPTFDPFAIVIRYPDDDGVTLRYYEWGDDQLFIDETTLELGPAEDEEPPLVTKREQISGVEALICERSLGPAWAEVSLEWKKGFVSYRVSYHRTSGGVDSVPIDEDEQYDDPEPEEGMMFDEPIEVDDAMRSNARRVAESLIRRAS